ncbi:MAG: hypothetical protein AB8B51_04900 [Sedimentitalea sp.]
MPTLVGLGFSSKVPASQHSIENHLTWLNVLLTELALSELIFVGQDWGGPLGAGALERSPELLKGIGAHGCFRPRSPGPGSSACHGHIRAGVGASDLRRVLGLTVTRHAQPCPKRRVGSAATRNRSASRQIASQSIAGR